MIALLLLLANGPQGPVPDGTAIKPRMLASLRQSEKALENYSCVVHEMGDELNADGSLKKRHASVQEQFFVNGIEIDHVLSRDGQPLSPSEAKKEQSRVDKAVKKYSDKEAAQKSQRHDEQQAELFLRALRLTNGRREERDGRATLVYALSGDPDFHPKKLAEQFARVLTGHIAIDEESGTPVEARFETTHDVKIGAGLLANLHKGFWLHFVQQREPDGAWITKAVDGSGDARAMLFMRARFRFSERLEKCHLFSVNAEQQIEKPEKP